MWDLSTELPGHTDAERSCKPKDENATGSRCTYLVLLILHELVDEVRADEAGPTGDEDPHVGLDQAGN